MNAFTRSLNLLLVVGMFFTVYITNATHEANELWPTDDPARTERIREERKSHPVNVPVWKEAYASKYPGCQKEAFDGFTNVLVMTESSRIVSMPFDEAYERADNTEHADNIWVLGFC